MQYDYFVNMDERGEFYADVRPSGTDDTIFEIKGFEIFEDGYMSHKYDLCALHGYLVELGIISEADTVVRAN